MLISIVCAYGRDVVVAEAPVQIELERSLVQIVVAHERREFQGVRILASVLAALQAEGIAEHDARRPRLVESPAHLGTKLQRGGFGLGVVPIYDGTAGK